MRRLKSLIECTQLIENDEFVLYKRNGDSPQYRYLHKNSRKFLCRNFHLRRIDQHSTTAQLHMRIGYVRRAFVEFSSSLKSNYLLVSTSNSATLVSSTFPSCFLIVQKSRSCRLLLTHTTIILSFSVQRNTENK